MVTGHKVSKIVIFSIILFIFFNLFLFATDARMGGLGVETWMINNDDMLMNLFPAQVINYQDEIEFGAINETAYINYTMAEYIFSAGINNYTLETAKPSLLNTDFFNGDNYSKYTASDNVSAYIVPTKSFYIAIARQLMSDAVIALKFCGARAADNGSGVTKSDLDSFYYSDGNRLSQDYNLTLGLTVKDFLDIGVTAGIPYAKNSGIVNYTSDMDVTLPNMNELMEYNYGIYGKVNARVVLSWLVIEASYTAISEQISDLQQEDGDNDGLFNSSGDINYQYNSSYRDYEMSGGAAANFKMTDSISSIAGISVNYIFNDIYKRLYDQNNMFLWESEEFCTDMFTVPVYFAVEDRINENITWRAGLKQVVFANKFGCNIDYTINPYNLTNFTAPVLLNTTFSSGLSYSIGNITLDGVITMGYGLTSEISGKLKF